MAAPDFPLIDARAARQAAEIVHGCTFDDFLLTPQLQRRRPARPVGDRSVVPRLAALTLKRPIVSANMDTVTRAPMAIVQAEEGGIGIIDRGFRPATSSRRSAKSRSSSARSTASSAIPTASRRRVDRGGAAADGAVARRHAGRRRRRAPAAGPADRARRAVRAAIADCACADRMTPVDRLVVHDGPISPRTPSA